MPEPAPHPYPRQPKRTQRLAQGLANVLPRGTGRRVYAALWPPSAALTALGLFGDARDVWTSHPYLLNLLSAVAGFCCGAPLVVSLLRFASRRIAESGAGVLNGETQCGLVGAGWRERWFA